MAQNRSSNTRPRSGETSEPWNVLHPRAYKTRTGEEGTDFLRCGVAFPLADKKGFSVQIFLEAPADEFGARHYVIMRRQRDDDEPR